MHKSFVLQVYLMPLHVSSTCVHHQEIKIALHSLWYHHTYRWPSHALVQVVARKYTALKVGNLGNWTTVYDIAESEMTSVINFCTINLTSWDTLYTCNLYDITIT